MFFISNVRFIVIVIVKRTCHVLKKYARIQISIPFYVEDKQEDIMSATHLRLFTFYFFSAYFSSSGWVEISMQQSWNLSFGCRRGASDSLKFDRYVYPGSFKGNCEFVAAL